MDTKRIRRSKPAKFIRNFLFGKRAVSVALTTMIITAGVIAAGIAVLYWAYSWGNIANTQYANTVGNSQNSIEESIAFEYVNYSSANDQLTVYVVNSGLSNGVTLDRLYLWNSSSQPIGTYNIGQLYRISDRTAISMNSLNKGDEGYFTVKPSANLSSGYYTLRIITGSGRDFDDSFSC
ncbi:MAG: hypothetical protein ABSF44_04000 [Candidatus Bathyarchaeia archaeon]